LISDPESEKTISCTLKKVYKPLQNKNYIYFSPFIPEKSLQKSTKKKQKSANNFSQRYLTYFV